MSEKPQVIGRPVSGSKPRKHITKINPHNPSLYALSITQGIELSDRTVQIPSGSG